MIAARYSISAEHLRGERRHQKIADIRMIGYWCYRELTELSFPQIGRVFNRDHSTVLHGCKRVDKLIRDGQPVGIEAQQTLHIIENHYHNQIELEL